MDIDDTILDIDDIDDDIDDIVDFEHDIEPILIAFLLGKVNLDQTCDSLCKLIEIKYKEFIENENNKDIIV